MNHLAPPPFYARRSMMLLPGACSLRPCLHWRGRCHLIAFRLRLFYLWSCWELLRPLGGQASCTAISKPELPLELLGVVVAGALISAAATDKIGVHPLFGAFLAGVCFPRINAGRLRSARRLDMLVSVLLLPLFFALTGMRTRLDLLNGWPSMAVGMDRFGRGGFR